MKSRWLINILLVVTIVILTLVARYEPGIDAPPAAQTLTPMSADAVEDIRINRPLREDLVLTREENGWIIDREPALPADGFQARALAKLAGQTAVRSYPVDELDLSRLALDPPYATVALNDTTIDFGTLEPLEELRYVRVGDQVHLISDLYQHLIEADYTQFVRRRLFAEQDRIVGLTLPELAITKTDTGWSVNPPQAVSADSLQRLVDNWQQATALHIRSAEIAAGNPPEIIVSLSDPDRQVGFLVAARDPELVLVRPAFAIQYRMGSLAQSLLSPGDEAAASAP
jgi:hypothetical protein